MPNRPATPEDIQRWLHEDWQVRESMPGVGVLLIGPPGRITETATVYASLDADFVNARLIAAGPRGYRLARMILDGADPEAIRTAAVGLIESAESAEAAEAAEAAAAPERIAAE